MYDQVNNTTKTVLVVKGEIAALVGESFGVLNCAPTNGEGGRVEEIVYPLVFATSVVVGDNNLSPGLMAATQERARLYNAILRFPPKPWDYDQWLLSDKTALDTIQQWKEEANENKELDNQ